MPDLAPPPAPPARIPAFLQPGTDLAELRIFSAIPRGYGVIAAVDDRAGPLIKRGEVVVYDEDWHRHGGLTPGLYVIQYQTPVACSPWPDSPRRVDRHIVRVEPSSGLKDHWWAHSPNHRNQRGPLVLSDGPYLDCDMYDLLIGRVVGLYHPVAGATQ